MSEKVLMKGNEAIAEAAIRAGCRHYFGYPITPQTELAAYMAKRMPKIGGTFLQAESEIAAINMVYGVASTGLRVMTSSSSPGVSLKQEGISYIAGADLPALIVNVQRGGPGLGGIQPSQSDYFQATKGGGHGDYHLIVLAPASVQEMADLTAKCFELADKYRMPSMLLADGTMGQMMEPVLLPEESNVTVEKPWALTGTKMQREHNIVNSLYLKPEELEKTNFDRYEKYKLIEENEVMYEEYMMEDAEVCVVAFGIAARVSKNAVVEARKQGIKAGLLRPITLWPFPTKAVKQAAEHCKGFVSVELSMGQMIEDIKLASDCARPVELCNRAGGMIPSPEQVLASIVPMVLFTALLPKRLMSLVLRARQSALRLSAALLWLMIILLAIWLRRHTAEPRRLQPVSKGRCPKTLFSPTRAMVTSPLSVWRRLFTQPPEMKTSQLSLSITRFTA